MILDINGKNYVVKFHTEKVDSGFKTEQGKRILTPVSTQCTITSNGEFVGAGYSKCHPKDNFEAEKGRQFSLKKALQDAEVSKEDRTVFWNTYRTWGTHVDRVVETTEDGEGEVEHLIPRTRF